jgi:hypothetical protein
MNLLFLAASEIEDADDGRDYKRDNHDYVQQRNQIEGAFLARTGNDIRAGYFRLDRVEQRNPDENRDYNADQESDERADSVTTFRRFTSFGPP